MGMFFERKGLLFIGRFRQLFGNREVCHGLSTRRGGVSDGPYDSLNLGSASGDSKSNVEENRRRFFEAMGISAEHVAIPGQVHGDRIQRVRDPGHYPETDGLLTDEENFALVVQVADCLPIYMYDATRRAMGMIHAGWRGTLLSISSKAVSAMKKHFGTNPRELQVFLGPSIGPCCYEVGDEVSSSFSEKYVLNGKLNLWQCNADQLETAGVKRERIAMSRLCTVCHSDWFFSHRASGGKTGRMMAVVMLNQK
ncbi:MAG: peptidoglycan editing factor PgeF [bacterium]